MEFPRFLDEVLRHDRRRVENVVVLARVGSTSTLARRCAGECLAESGRVHPALVVAFEQDAGRGRRGRRWESPAGVGVYATYVLPLADRGALETLPLLAAVGLCRGMNRHLQGACCRLKWPNDLVVEGRKIGGLLIEVVSAEDHPGAALLGFGINWGQAEGELPGAAATSLRLATRRPPDLPTLLWDLVDALTVELQHLGDGPYAAAEYAGLSAHRDGERLRCRLGGELVEGLFRGFDRRGFLRLDCDDRERLLSAGEVLAE